MIHSESFKAIPKALVAIQSQVRPAAKDAKNDYFDSPYADLESVINSVRPIMVQEGLSLMQFPSTDYVNMVETKATMREGDSRNRSQKIVDIRVPTVGVETRLDHADSGEWLTHTMSMLPMDNSPQAIGSTITYARRYSLNAILGLISEDDDGNAGSDASGRQNLPSQQKSRQTAAKAPASPSNFGAPTPPPKAKTSTGGAGGRQSSKPGVPYAINEKEQQDRGCINATLVAELRQAVLDQDKKNKLDPTSEFLPWLDQEYLEALYAAPGMKNYERKYKGKLQAMLDIPSTAYREILDLVQNQPDVCKPGYADAAAQAGHDGVA